MNRDEITGTFVGGQTETYLSKDFIRTHFEMLNKQVCRRKNNTVLREFKVIQKKIDLKDCIHR